MKTKVTFRNKNGVKEREIDYIPIRFILAILLIVLETVAVIGITFWCGANIPWLVFVLVVPVAGFMIWGRNYFQSCWKI